MTREQELECLHKDLVHFAEEWCKDIERLEKDLGQAYAHGRADAYQCAATWLRQVLGVEVTDEETV